MPSGYPNNGKPNKGWFKKGQKFNKVHKKKISEGVKKHLPKTAFKKGQNAWNKDKKCPWVKNNPQTFKNGHTPWSKGKKLPQWSGKSSCHWRGGRIFNNAGYIMVYQPNHPSCDKRKYVFEHRLVVEKQIRRYLKPEETIHHLGIKTDNRPQMLMAFVNNSAHKKFHGNPNHVKSKEIIFDGRKLT